MEVFAGDTEVAVDNLTNLPENADMDKLLAPIQKFLPSDCKADLDDDNVWIIGKYRYQFFAQPALTIPADNFHTGGITKSWSINFRSLGLSRHPRSPR